MYNWRSGSGKSTFLDLLMGVVKPSEGKIFIDGIEKSLTNLNWQNNIGFVNQNIFITSDSLKKNIAFGFEDNEIDISKINYLLEFCNLKNFTKSLENELKRNL